MAVRIAGVTLPANKRAEIGLTYIFGIGRNLSNKILESAQINCDTKIQSLSEDEVNKLRQLIEKEYRVEGELKREILGNIKRLKEIKCYRGDRHTKNLPCRGQKTKSNTRTCKGNVRKTMGSGRKPTAQKT